MNKNSPNSTKNRLSNLGIILFFPIIAIIAMVGWGDIQVDGEDAGVFVKIVFGILLGCSVNGVIVSVVGALMFIFSDLEK